MNIVALRFADGSVADATALCMDCWNAGADDCLEPVAGTVGEYGFTDDCEARTCMSCGWNSGGDELEVAA